jgi:sugar phosphate isomerase/epimerase
MFAVGVSLPSDENLIRRASARGISYVELAYFPPLEGRIDSLREVLRASRVKPSSFHAPYGLECDIGSFDPDHRRSAIEQHKKHIQYCASLGCSCYVVHPGLDSYMMQNGGSWDDTKKIAIVPRNEETIGKLWKTNSSAFAEIADSAAGLGVVVAAETGPANIMSPQETLDIVRRADRKNLGVCLDSGHVNVGKIIRPADAIRLIGPLLCTVHLHDNNGEGDLHLVPGRGSIDWKGVVKALEDANYGGVLNLELAPADWKDEAVWEQIEEGVAFLSHLRP